MYEVITKNLKKESSKKDIEIFEKWERGQYITKEALILFKENNDITKTISLKLFEYWLESLGYRRIK